MIAVEYLRDLRKASADPLLGSLDQAAAAPFDRTAWWQELARQGDLQPLLAVARSPAGATVLPLAQTGGRLSGLANWYTFRWRPVFTADADRAGLLEAIAGDLRRRAWRIDIGQVPDEDASATLLTQALRTAGWLVRQEAHDVNHVLDVRGRDYAAYLAMRPGALRAGLKRKADKVTCTITTSFDDITWAHYEAVYAASWKPTEGDPAFLRRFACSEGAAGRLRLGLAYAGETPVAAQFWTVERGTAFIHKLAHRSDARSLSPGTVLTAALMRHVLDEDRVAWIDFGTGDDAYKRHWMEDIRARYHISALNPSHPLAWPALVRRMLGRLAPARARSYRHATPPDVSLTP